MNVVMFYHSLLSDWNHGNAHFLRGIVAELQCRGHSVHVHEPQDGWSLRNLVSEHGDEPLRHFRRRFPDLRSTRYEEATLDLDEALHDADLVIVHEWNSHHLVQQIGAHHDRHPHYTLLFHDTHHRSVSDPANMARYDLGHYDGALVFGRAIRDVYLSHGWAKNVWVWHEAADTRVFRPAAVHRRKRVDVVWIGNWGDEERTEELLEFLVEPVRRLGVTAEVYGVRYPESARRLLAAAGIAYKGWLPNYSVPDVFAQGRLTIHVPRRPYAHRLPGIPTIRPFEALACGIPMISAPWQDCEGMFRAGHDYLVACDAGEMQRQMERVLTDADTARSLAGHGPNRIRSRHTCAHRVRELLAICRRLKDRRSKKLTKTVDNACGGGRNP
jgi:spore maturation protein CgeB